MFSSDIKESVGNYLHRVLCLFLPIRKLPAKDLLYNKINYSKTFSDIFEIYFYLYMYFMLIRQKKKSTLFRHLRDPFVSSQDSLKSFGSSSRSSWFSAFFYIYFHLFFFWRYFFRIYFKFFCLISVKPCSLNR